ncbi:efflux RND transporter periplasmic adaptor subunit [Aminirod propionatiphilus]|uniref:Efflux RND transporter periplasmic adaptor subunit n=1 Tax=Aminirod propionatiphilus TaxID=3415223 RepID=A0ACD1DWE5_9BACT|nr:efflux RND transporter periplasmic adaptor subunit [Synergistota bacterium]
MIKKLFFLVAVAALAAGGYFYFRKPEPALSFLTAEVTRRDIVQTVSATGTIEAVNTVDVGTQVSGTINKIFTDYNGIVKAGQVIATIDPILFEAEVAAAEADLAVAQAGVAEEEADLNDARRDYERKKTLFAKDFIAASEVDTAMSTFEGARARVTSAKATVLQARAKLDKARANLNYTTITSPLDGVVVAKDVSEGQTVAASYSTPTLFTIAEDLTKMQVEAAVDEADIGYLREGMKALFTVDSYPSDTFEGYVHQVRFQAETEENVVTYTVVVRVDNQEMKLKPGMTANVTFEIASARRVLAVPNAAFRFSPPGEAAGGDLLWIAGEGGSLRALPVERGLSDGLFTAVSGDVEEGQTVVTAVTGTTKATKKADSAPPRPGMF